jgi:hypothetical protein
MMPATASFHVIYFHLLMPPFHDITYVYKLLTEGLN